MMVNAQIYTELFQSNYKFSCHLRLQGNRNSPKTYEKIILSFMNVHAMLHSVNLYFCFFL